MCLWMIAGMAILQESQYYSWGKLFSMFGSFLVCCIGIRILMSKIKNQRLVKWRERVNSVTYLASSSSMVKDDDFININNLNNSEISGAASVRN